LDYLVNYSIIGLSNATLTTFGLWAGRCKCGMCCMV